MESQTLRIGGMTCANCQNRIEKKLKSIAGIVEASADYSAGTATVAWDAAAVSLDEIRAAIETLGYTVLKHGVKTPALEIIGSLLLVFALYMLLRALGLNAAATAFPLAEAGMGYAMLFIIGLATSVHCVAMCGGINLSQCLQGEKPPTDAGKRPAVHLFAAPFLYNAGRVVSYTAVGAIAGALGQVITVSGRFQGIVQIAAGVFMVLMGINMLGLFPALRRFVPRLPKFFAKNIKKQTAAGKSPLLVGLLNGLMPCGPLQAMQLYALSTGSPVAGGIAMFLFSVGTVPLMFGIGALGSFLSGKFTRAVMRVGAILVTVMGLMMFTYGWALSGFRSGSAAAGASAAKPSVLAGQNSVQIINSVLSPGRYPAITVQQGIPVRWTISAPPGSINGCNNRMLIREYGIEHRFAPGENVIEFTPVRAGKIPYSCWMGMIRSSITVLAAGDSAPADSGGAHQPILEPVPAGVDIPTEKIGVAKIAGNFQTVVVNLRDDGIEPAVIVMQKGVPAAWTISNHSLDPGNSRLIVPAYYSRLDMEQGDNVIRLIPTADFDFSTADNVFYGYVKVVNDINNFDIAAVQAEISTFETLIYPQAYFDMAGMDDDDY